MKGSAHKNYKYEYILIGYREDNLYYFKQNSKNNLNKDIISGSKNQPINLYIRNEYTTTHSNSLTSQYN